MHGPEDFLDAVRRDDAAALHRWLARRPGMAGLGLADGTSPVTLAVRLGRTRALAALLEVGVAAWTTESDPEGPPTALMVAAARGDAAAVALLLEHGADPALRDPQGRSAADWAEAHGHRDLARRLGAEAERGVPPGPPPDAAPAAPGLPPDAAPAAPGPPPDAAPAAPGPPPDAASAAPATPPAAAAAATPPAPTR